MRRRSITSFHGLKATWTELCSFRLVHVAEPRQGDGKRLESRRHRCKGAQSSIERLAVMDTTNEEASALSRRTRARIRQFLEGIEVFIEEAHCRPPRGVSALTCAA